MFKYRFSIFTATYNRGELLRSVYKDLLQQTFKDFEWVIVSDGSEDNTDDIVASFQKQGQIHINYIRKANGGKHTAWRVATPLFQGRYVVCLDDDDLYLNSMLDIFDKEWKVLESSPSYDLFWEVRARCSDTNGNLIGEQYISPLDISWNDIVYKYKNACEMISCRKLEVLQHEAAVPDTILFSDKITNFSEIIRWSRAARKYKSRIIDCVMRVYRFKVCDDSLSSSKKNSIQVCYNGLVGGIYILNEQSDLMLAGKAWRLYISNIISLVNNALITKEDPTLFLNGRITRLLFKTIYHGYKLMKY